MSARIKVDPLGAEGVTDEEGFFELDVPAGEYTVSIEADGYRVQQKKVVVEEAGVVVLNADLLRAQ